MANETLQFFGIHPDRSELFTWWAWDRFLLFELLTEDYSINTFDVVSRQDRVTKYGLTGRAENHIHNPAYYETRISLKVFDFDKMIQLRDWYSASSAGGLDFERNELFPIDYPTNLNQTGLSWVRFSNVNMPEAESVAPIVEGATSVTINAGNFLDIALPYVLIDGEHRRTPRRHHINVTGFDGSGPNLIVFFDPATLTDFPQKSLFRPAIQTEPAIVTNPSFLDEFDDDMLFWRFECSLRSVHSTYRFAGI